MSTAHWIVWAGRLYCRCYVRFIQPLIFNS